MEVLLPCPKCRKSYVIHRQSIDKRVPLSSMNNVRKWLYQMKNTVNKSLEQTSVMNMNLLEKRYTVFDSSVNDLNLTDLLMFVHLAASGEKHEKFVRLCNLLGTVLNKILIGPLPVLLLCVNDNSNYLETVNALRETYNLPQRTIEHYNIS